jgi:hypothetical protein
VFYCKVALNNFYENNEVYSIVLNYDKKLFNIPSGILEKGRDYYISIAISDTTSFGEYETSHFRIKGSRWNESVDNSVGWTIETLFFVDSSSVEYDDYQVIRIGDGTRFAEIKIKSNEISFISEEIMTYSIDLTNYRILTVAGKNDDIKIYIDRKLVIDGSSKFKQSLSSKMLEFGCPTNGEFYVNCSRCKFWRDKGQTKLEQEQDK